jgi:hypothetical protein
MTSADPRHHRSPFGFMKHPGEAPSRWLTYWLQSWPRAEQA